MGLRGYSPNTQKHYSSQVRLLEKYLDKPSDQILPDEIKEYLHHRVKSGIGYSSINIACNAFKVMFNLVLQRNFSDDVIVRPKKPKEFLFPGLNPDKPLAARNAQQAFKTAKEKTSVLKPVTVHSLRHSFATHLLEDNTDLRTIQILLGHANISTTYIYLPLSTKHLASVKSPLDKIDPHA